MKIKHVLLAVVLGSLSTITLAQSGQAKEDGAKQGRRGPPPQALAACASSNAGDACSFTGRRGERAGSCWAPEGKPLACKPSNARKRGGKRRNQ
jgi:hypothetical protein